MTIVRLIWISAKWWKGGLQVAFQANWPWDQLCVGYRCEDHAYLCGKDEEYVQSYSIYCLLLTLSITHVRMTDTYLEQLREELPQNTDRW